MTQTLSMSGLAELLRKPLRSQPEGVKRAARELWTEMRLARASRHSARAFGALNGRSGLKVHLGCGVDVRTGWVNVDLFLGPAPTIDPVKRPHTVLIIHDLRAGLPLAEGSCDLIYSSHFFEHLSFPQGLRLMQDCYRALRRDGTFRIVLPDFGKCFDAYLRKDADFFALLDEHRLLNAFEPKYRTLVDYINYVVYQYGEHLAIYDEEKVSHILRTIGYRAVVRSEHQSGMDPESDLRRRYSFYVEATK